MITSLLIMNVASNKKFMAVNQFEGNFKRSLSNGDFKKVNKYEEIQVDWDSNKDNLVFKKIFVESQEGLILKAEELGASILSYTIDKPKNISTEDDGGIYAIYNIKENRYYIGSTKDFYSRYLTHKSNLATNTHRCKYLQEDFNRLGRECFKFMKLLKVEDFTILEYEEMKIIKKYIEDNIPVYNSVYIEDGKKYYSERGFKNRSVFIENKIKTTGKPLICTFNNIETEYSCIHEASRQTGIQVKRIHEVLKGFKNNGNGKLKKVNHCNNHFFKYKDEVLNSMKVSFTHIPPICAVYAIVNILNNKKFIRKTLDFNSSIGKHKAYFGKNKLIAHLSREIQKDYDLFGENNFKYEILEKTTPELLDTKLSETIARYTKDELYN